MPTIDFYIKKGDTSPAIEGTLLDGNGDAVNLTGATLAFIYKRTDDALPVERVATIVTAASGTVKYEWVEEDTATATYMTAEWEVTFQGGFIATFPNDGNLIIRVGEEIGSIV